MLSVFFNEDPLYDFVSFYSSTYLHEGFSRICSNPYLKVIKDLFVSYFFVLKTSESKFLFVIRFSIDIELKSILEDEKFLSVSYAVES